MMKRIMGMVENEHPDLSLRTLLEMDYPAQAAYSNARRMEAKAAGRTRYFTGMPCYQGHISERFVSSRGCVACQEIKQREARIAEARRQGRSYLPKKMVVRVLAPTREFRRS